MSCLLADHVISNDWIADFVASARAAVIKRKPAEHWIEMKLGDKPSGSASVVECLESMSPDLLEYVFLMTHKHQSQTDL